MGKHEHQSEFQGGGQGIWGPRISSPDHTSLSCPGKGQGCNHGRTCCSFSCRTGIQETEDFFCRNFFFFQLISKISSWALNSPSKELLSQKPKRWSSSFCRKNEPCCLKEEPLSYLEALPASGMLDCFRRRGFHCTLISLSINGLFQ